MSILQHAKAEEHNYIVDRFFPKQQAPVKHEKKTFNGSNLRERIMESLNSLKYGFIFLAAIGSFCIGLP